MEAFFQTSVTCVKEIWLKMSWNNEEVGRQQMSYAVTLFIELELKEIIIIIIIIIINK